MQALAHGSPGLEQARDLLSHIYQIQGRFDDDKLLREASLADAQDPVRVLRQLSGLDFDRIPYVGLLATLENAGELAPEDDRVWLGKGRMAIEAGRWEEARKWLGRCRAAGLADGTVWRAWLKLARGSGRPDEAVDAARQLGPGDLDACERLALRAWLHETEGDTQAETMTLEHWLRLEPAATAALERLAELAQRAGQLGHGQELRRRKAEVERSLASYRDRLRSDRPLQTAVERYELARLAAAAGRHREARALLNWARQVDPGDRSARELLAMLDQAESERLAALAADHEPWPEIEPPGRSPKIGPAPTNAGGVVFTDDAEAIGLKFVYDNPETPIHQLPEPFGGGLAILDYDGDGWLDVYCVQGGPYSAVSGQSDLTHGLGDRLFHNRGDGTFEDVSIKSGIAAVSARARARRRGGRRRQRWPARSFRHALAIVCALPQQGRRHF